MISSIRWMDESVTIRSISLRLLNVDVGALQGSKEEDEDNDDDGNNQDDEGVNNYVQYICCAVCVHACMSEFVVAE